jgi:hypothetical protein
VSFRGDCPHKRRGGWCPRAAVSCFPCVASKRERDLTVRVAVLAAQAAERAVALRTTGLPSTLDHWKEVNDRENALIEEKRARSLALLQKREERLQQLEQSKREQREQFLRRAPLFERSSAAVHPHATPAACLSACAAGCAGSSSSEREHALPLAARCR